MGDREVERVQRRARRRDPNDLGRLRGSQVQEGGFQIRHREPACKVLLVYSATDSTLTKCNARPSASPLEARAVARESAATLQVRPLFDDSLPEQ